MARLIIIAILIVALWYAGWQVVRYLKGQQIDWTGVTFAAAFIALAFYLRAVTEIV